MTLDEPRVRVTTNLAFGICLILLGTTLVLDRLQLVDAREVLRFWPIALVLFGAALVAQSLQRPGATAGTKRDTFEFGQVVFWVLIWTFLWTGFSSNGFSGLSTTARTETANSADLVAILGREDRVINASGFRGGQMTSIMGRTELDLRTATIEPGQDVSIEVFMLMGGATIRVCEMRNPHVPEGAAARRARGAARPDGVRANPSPVSAESIEVGENRDGNDRQPDRRPE